MRRIVQHGVPLRIIGTTPDMAEHPDAAEHDDFAAARQTAVEESCGLLAQRFGHFIHLRDSGIRQITRMALDHEHAVVVVGQNLPIGVGRIGLLAARGFELGKSGRNAHPQSQFGPFALLFGREILHVVGMHHPPRSVTQPGDDRARTNAEHNGLPGSGIRAAAAQLPHVGDKTADSLNGTPNDGTRRNDVTAARLGEIIRYEAENQTAHAPQQPQQHVAASRAQRIVFGSLRVGSLRFFDGLEKPVFLLFHLKSEIKTI